MKKFVLILVILVIGLSSQSQVLITLIFGEKLNSPNVEFGLEGGINWTQITGMETKNFARKWNLGFYFDFRLKNNWWLNTGVLVKANMGVNNLSDNDLANLNATIYTSDTTGRIPGSYGQRMNYFLVPALAKYKFKKGIFVAAGPQFGLMYKAWVQFDSDVEGNDAIIKEYNKELIPRIDVGIMAELGYSFFQGAGLSLGVKYYEGFVNVYKDIPGTRNRSFFLYATLPIGASDKAKQKALEKSKQREEKKAAKEAAKKEKKK